MNRDATLWQFTVWRPSAHFKTMQYLIQKFCSLTLNLQCNCTLSSSCFALSLLSLCSKDFPLRISLFEAVRCPIFQLPGVQLHSLITRFHGRAEWWNFKGAGALSLISLFHCERGTSGFIQPGAHNGQPAPAGTPKKRRSFSLSFSSAQRSFWRQNHCHSAFSFRVCVRASVCEKMFCGRSQSHSI